MAFTASATTSATRVKSSGPSWQQLHSLNHELLFLVKIPRFFGGLKGKPQENHRFGSPKQRHTQIPIYTRSCTSTLRTGGMGVTTPHESIRTVELCSRWLVYFWGASLQNHKNKWGTLNMRHPQRLLYRVPVGLESKARQIKHPPTWVCLFHGIPEMATHLPLGFPLQPLKSKRNDRQSLNIFNGSVAFSISNILADSAPF